MCLLRSFFFSGLSRSSTYPRPAQPLPLPFSNQFCSSCSMLSFKEPHPVRVQSIDKPRILRGFPYSLLPVSPDSFSCNLYKFKAFSCPKLQFLPPQLKKKNKSAIIHLHLSIPGLKMSLCRKSGFTWCLLPRIFSLSKIRTLQF